MTPDKRASVSPGGSGPAGHEIERDALRRIVELLAPLLGGEPSVCDAEDVYEIAQAALDEVRAAGSECDGGFNCPATRHIEGCYTGEGHPQAVRAAGRAGEGQTSAEFSGAPEGSNDGAE